MTSGTVAGLNASHSKPPSAEETDQSYAVRSPSSTKRSSVSSRSDSLASPVSAHSASNGSSSKRRNGDANGHHDESEAETEILDVSDSEQNSPKSKNKAKTIKIEEHDDGDDARRRPSPLRHARKSSDSSVRRNGASEPADADGCGGKRAPNGDANEGGATTRHLAHGNKSSGNTSQLHLDTGRRASASTDTTASPTVASSEYGRAASAGGIRKRKIREEHHFTNLEPPRQRLKSDSSAKTPGSATHNLRNQPTSPFVPSPGLRLHKRSASTQSAVPNAQGRRQRELSTGHDRKSWKSETSSDGSSSPQPYSPALQNSTTSRARRSTQRSALSPARNTQMPAKKNYDRFGATRLARECAKQPANLDAVKAAFEEHPEELNQRDFAGYEPVQKAALSGNTKVVKYLISKGCRLQTQSDNGDTPLIDATENAHADIVRLLLDHGVNPHHANHSGARAIDAVDKNDDENREAFDQIEKLLLKAMRDHSNHEDDSDGGPPLKPRDGLKAKDRQDLLYLESNIGNLRKFSSLGDYQAVHQFLMGGVAPDNLSAVNAARAGHEDVLNLLMANPSFKGDRDPDPTKNRDETPLVAAIGRGHLGVIKILIAQDGFNPSRKTTEGKTYWELAEERRGPKWQQEKELLEDKFDEWKTKRRAEKKRRMDAHPSEKSAKIQKVSCPESPRSKNRQQRTSSPAPLERKKKSIDKPSKPKIKREKSEDTQLTTGTPVRKLSGDAGKERRSKETHVPNREGKPRKRRVVDDDESDSDHATKQESSAKQRRDSGGVLKARKESASGPSTVREEKEKIRHKERRPSTSKPKKTERRPAKENDAAAMDDEEKPDAPPEPVRRKPKQHTPDPVRLQRIADREKEANRRRLAAERERLAEEQRIAEQNRIEWLARVEKLPLALRHACLKGRNRPLHFSGDEMGVSMSFLPIHTVQLSQIDPQCSLDRRQEQWMLSFQAVGILGLRELDLSRTVAKNWNTIPTTSDLRQRFLGSYDIVQVAQTTQPVDEDEEAFDATATDRALAETRQQFLSMEPLCWVKVQDFEKAVAEEDWLESLNITKSSLSLMPNSGLETPTSFEGMIRGLKGIVVNHQEAVLTPPVTENGKADQENEMSLEAPETSSTEKVEETNSHNGDVCIEKACADAEAGAG